MSPRFRAAGGHDRARELAARRVDEVLEPAEAAWLDGHLAGCEPCAAAADAYEADRLLFAPLRDARPLPPRDLWARTAAAIDAEPGPDRPVIQAPRPARRAFGLPLVSLAPIAAVAAVALLVGSAFLDGSPVVPPPAGSPEPTAIAITTGDVAVLTRNADGGLEFRVAGVDEVCPLVADGCGAAEPSFEVAQLAQIDTGDTDTAIISPARDSLVVVGRDATGSNGVYVVPVRQASVAATPDVTPPVPTDGPTAAPTASPTPMPAETATPEPSPSSEAPSGDVATEAPSTASPEPTDPATPEPTPDPTPAPTEEPTAVVTVTPEPDGAIRIASDVVVVGSVAAYNEDGSRFAFSARPADGSTGPDVYVWDTADTRARAVTTDHRSIFAGWDGRDLLVSRVTRGQPQTLAVSARGIERGEHGADAWLPTVSPDGTRAVWWDGTVTLDDDGVTWRPDEGRLVLGSWPGDAADAQVLARGIRDWEVAWDPDGTAVVTWTGQGKRAGRLNVYSVDPATGRADLDAPLLEDESAYAGFAVEHGRVVFKAPGKGGEPTVWMVGWDGDEVGRVELPGGTVIR